MYNEDGEVIEKCVFNATETIRSLYLEKNYRDGDKILRKLPIYEPEGFFKFKTKSGDEIVVLYGHEQISVYDENGMIEETCTR